MNHLVFFSTLTQSLAACLHLINLADIDILWQSVTTLLGLEWVGLLHSYNNSGRKRSGHTIQINGVLK